MKTKKPILRLAALAALSFFTGNEIVAQTNIGAACGCPSYATRPVASITTAGTWTTLPSSAYGKELLGNQNVILTCDKTWTLDEKLYVGSGSTLTIQPGTVIKGNVAQSAAAATALIIERGGKIMAPGVEECPIIFTALADALTGAYPVNNKGMWGGVLICGKASNNLTLAQNGPFIPGAQGKLAAADGLGVLEGFASSYPQDQFGVATSLPTNISNAAYSGGTLPATYDMVFDAAATLGSSANASGSLYITFTSSSVANSDILIGQPVFVGGNQIGTITEISTSSPYSSNQPRIKISTALASSINTGDDITIVGTFPALPSNFTGNYFTYTSTTLPFASGTGAFQNIGGNVWINYAAPYLVSGGAATFEDNDNSGIMTYVSIRHSGANLLVGSEINGLTLASVGRGTKIEHIEIVSCADDNIEIFGGTVDLKYCTTLYGNDDMYDYDLGWTGKAQFLFGMKADHAGTPHVSQDNDNGFECDGGDNAQNLNPSNPTIYNATILGNAKTAGTADNRAVAAMNFKEGAKGTLNNSVFAHFNNGLNVESANTGSNPLQNTLQNWAMSPNTGGNGTGSLQVKCNTFIGVTNPMVQNASSLASTGTVVASNTTQFTADGNLTLDQAAGVTAGFKYAFAINGTTNAITTKNDVVPNVGVAAFQLATTGSTTCAQAPMDGFFAPANYRGAFAPSANNENWLSDWTYSQVLNSTSGVSACPTDINNDGTTDVNDFLIFSGAFGQACN
jgi:hypothetical protein